MAITQRCEISECDNAVMMDRDYCIKHRNHTKCPQCQQKTQFPNSYSGILTCPICRHEYHTPKTKTQKKRETKQLTFTEGERAYKEKNRSPSPHKMNFETMISYGYENLKANILTILIPIPFWILGVLIDENEVLSGFFLLLGLLLALMASMGLLTKLIADAVSYSIYKNSKEINILVERKRMNDPNSENNNSRYCMNCGSENSIANAICKSCSVPLKHNRRLK